MTSVLHQVASLSNASQLSLAGDFTYGIWLKCNAGQYGTATFNPLFAFGVPGGSSEGFLLQVSPGTNANLEALVFRGGGSDTQFTTILTGNDVDWVYVVLRHASASLNYNVSWRRQNQLVFTTVVLPLSLPLVSAGSIYIGASQFGDTSKDSDSRSFFCQQSNLSDADLLTVSQNLDSLPAGTNLHFLPLVNAGTATSNSGTAGTWSAPSGTLQTAATQPVEGLPASPASRLVGDPMLGFPF